MTKMIYLRVENTIKYKSFSLLSQSAEYKMIENGLYLLRHL